MKAGRLIAATVMTAGILAVGFSGSGGGDGGDGPEAEDRDCGV